MKKKQLLAFIMAGTLVTGMAPATAAFAEDTQTMTIDDAAAVAVESEEGSEAVAEPAADTTDGAEDSATDSAAEPDAPAEPDASAQTPAAEPTQEAAETPAADNAAGTEEATDEGFGSGETEEMAMEDADIAVQAEENASGKIYVQTADGNQKEYQSLKEAITAAPAGVGKDGALTQILVTGSIEISETLVIDQDKNVSIAAAEDGVTITRASGFKGDMFKVTGANTSFQFGTGKSGDAILELTVNGTMTEGDADGSIVSMDSGYFGISDGITLTGNLTNAAGSAICNKGGSGAIALAGGTITGNQSLDETTGGAIYSEGEIRVSGSVVVKDNKDDSVNDNSIVLNGDKACIVAAGALAADADLQVRRADAAAGKALVALAENAGTTIADALAHIHYLDATYTINSTTGELEEVKDPVSSMELTADSISWNKAYDHTVDISFHANDAGEGGRYYIAWMKKSDSTPSFDEVKKDSTDSGYINGPVSISIGGVAYDTPIKVVVYGEDVNGLQAVKPLVITLKAKATPPTETPTTPTPTTRATINPSVSESKVTGLEDPLAFYPNTMYNFKVTGAGTDNTSPVKGDTKWIPYGWSMSAKNIDTGYQKSWSIKNVNGIKQAKTFKMYIFFQKYIYNGSEWEATGVKEALPTEFKSKAIDFTITPSGTITPTATDGYDDGYGNGGSGDGTGDGTGDDAENHDGTDSDTGSSSATNARTADNSPIATMMMLASLSLVAGGYVIVRKRKKEDEI
ncbi:hypothetical protein ACTQWG_02255 [Blautia sp. HCP3S3_H10_1]|uniref:hypothetical protein n=1 Tax=unclassified Blautia TaxID=2648079 RepID=UPI003F8DAC42